MKIAQIFTFLFDSFVSLIFTFPFSKGCMMLWTEVKYLFLNLVYNVMCVHACFVNIFVFLRLLIYVLSGIGMFIRRLC